MRTILLLSIMFFLQGCFSAPSVDNQKPLFQFATLADCQYCDQDQRGKRDYRGSLARLEKCVDHCNNQDLTYSVHLGDFIDKDHASFAPLQKLTAKLKAPIYHVLGNHDFSVADEYKSQVPSILGMPARYYDFKVKNWRFIILDGNDISTHAYPKDSPKYKESKAIHKKEYARQAHYNGALSATQLKWIESILQKSQVANEQVALYCHFPVYPQDGHNLWNAKAVINLLEKYSCVKAYINGHNHKGNYAVKEGIHYLTLKGMVENKEPTYGIIDVYSDRLEFKGQGAETDRKMILR